MIDVVAFPFHDAVKVAGEGWFRRDNQLLRELEQRGDVGKVLVVDRPSSIPLAAYATVRRRPWRLSHAAVIARGRGWRLTRLSSKSYVLDTFIPDVFHTFALRRGWWARSLSEPHFRAAIRSACEHLEITDPVAWAFTPLAAQVASEVGTRAFVFDAIDDWLLHPGMGAYRDAALAGYEIAIQKADLITCVAADLAQRFTGARGHVMWVPNGVGDEFLKRAPIPADLDRLPRPRAGYAGVLEDRLDVELLLEVTASLPAVQFCFVGPDRSRVAHRLSAPNCHFIGQRPYSAMPGYISGFDVAMVPHRVNQFTARMNPLKLYEYLAIGTPVVSTPVAGAEMFGTCVSIADNAPDFGSAIEAALAAGAPPEKCRSAIWQHSWRTRVNEVMATLLAQVLAPERSRERGGDS